MIGDLKWETKGILEMKKKYVRYTGITTAKPCSSSLYGDENTLTWQMQNG